jgi:hypothetical protein
MRFISSLAALLLVVLLSACGGGGGSPGTPIGTTPTALFTTAPSGLTLTVGSAQAFSVGGGNGGPYTAVSSDSSVAAAGVSGTELTLGAVRPGSAVVTVRDSLGATTAVTVTTKPVRALFTTAPATVTISIGNSAAQTYQVGGGVGPYVISNSNPSVLSAVLSGTTLTVTGLAAGSADLIVQDSVGGSLSISATVAAVPTIDLFTTAAPSVTLPNGTAALYAVGGGTGPYTATSSNTGVATVSLDASGLTIRGGASGSTTVTVRDNAGHSVPVAVTVSPVTSFFTTAPSAVTVGVGSGATYTVGGGVFPYTAASSNSTVATASISGTTLSINGVAVGAASVVLRDSANTIITVAVTVKGASTLDLFTTAPSAVTIAKGTTTSYSIGGGTSPYSATSSDNSIATVIQSGSGYSITGVANGAGSVVIRDTAGASVTVTVSVSATQMSLNPTTVDAFIGDTVYSALSGGAGPYSIVEGFPDAADVDLGTLSGNTFTPNASGNILRVAVKKAVNADVIVIKDSSGNSAIFTLNATAGTSGISLAPDALSIGEEYSGPITLLVKGGVGTVNLFSSNPSLITVGSSVTGSGFGSTAVTVTKTTGEVCTTGEVTITAIDSTGAKATSLITVEDHGNNPAPCPRVVP